MFLRILTLGLLSTSIFAASQLVTLRSETPQELATYLNDLGYDVAGHSNKRGVVSVVTEFPFLLEILQRDSLVSFQVETVEGTQPYLQYSGRSAFDGEETYLGPDEILKELKKLAERFPAVAKVYNLNEMVGTPLTTEGRAIYGLHVSSHPSEIEDKPKLLINGQHHARELMTQHAVLDAAKKLLESNERGNSEAKRSVQNLSIWFVPVINPDGLHHVLTQDRMWRKNRAKNPGGTRGVDLNRNYSVKWGACGINSDAEESEVFKGITPDSEPEVRLMEALNDTLHFTYSISYHSYGDEILQPYLCGNLAEATIYDGIRDQLKALLKFESRPPSSGGEDHEYHYNHFGTLAYLLELGDEFQPPFSTYRTQVWPVVEKVLPYIANEALAHGTVIRVTDASSAAPLKAELTIKEINFSEGERRVTDKFGTHRWRLPLGNYELTVSAPGYETKVIKLNLNSEVSLTNVSLQRNWGMLSLQDISRWLFSFSS